MLLSKLQLVPSLIPSTPPALMAGAPAASSAQLTLLRWAIPLTFLPPSSPRHFSCFLPSSTIFISVSVSVSVSHPFPLSLPSRHKRAPRVRAVTEEQEKAAPADAEELDGGEDGVPEEARAPARPCELYVCNLPRSCDISQILDLFKPLGTVLSVEVSRDSETGVSRGCAFVTMSSIDEAKVAIAALDGSDLGGREMRVKFSVDMVSRRKNTEALNTSPRKNLVFESPHKVYVGNLAWSVRPEDLREHFSQFGTVMSARLLSDRKGGKNRVYGFLSFSSDDELKAAIQTSGSVFHGRTLLVKEVVNRE